MPTSYLLRFRVREGTAHETDLIGSAEVGTFEPAVSPTPIRFRFKLREGWRR